MDQPVTMEVELPPDQTSTATTESTTATTITVPSGSLGTPTLSGGQKVIPVRLPIKVVQGLSGSTAVPSKPITLQCQTISGPIPRGLKLVGHPSTSPTLLVTPSPPPQQPMRPTILQSKPVVFKKDLTSSDKGAAISLGNIVTADGTTTLKIAGSGVTPPSALPAKLPNIIRSQQPLQQQHSQGNPSQVIRTHSRTEMSENATEVQLEVSEQQLQRQQLQQQQLPTTVQIFPLTAGDHQQPQTSVMCLSIVNGKIQNIQEPSQSSPSEPSNLTGDDEMSSEIMSESDKKESKEDNPEESSVNLDLLKPLEEIFFRPQESEKDPDEENRDPEKLEDFGLTCSTNEFNAVEIANFQSESTGQDVDHEDEDDSIDLSCKEVPPPSPRKDCATGPRIRDDDILCCGGCGCYGMAGEFLNTEACSTECLSRIVLKIREKEKRERELQAQKSRREAKKKEREAREAEERRLREAAERDRRHKEELEAKLEAEANMRMAHQENTITAMSTPPAKFITDEHPVNQFLPWKAEGSFHWDDYLRNSGTKAAPSKLFKCPFPAEENPFSVGMKLEAIDPEHPALICVVTVAEIQGYRLRLHFDGYPETFDFWENANSPNIFHAGWCASKRQKLQPPKSYAGKEFKWPTYLRETDSKAAPFQAFRHRPEAGDVSGWRVGLKLEAVDRQNTSLVCVATVTNIMDGRLLVHFDGWELDFDYWTTPSSPYIHPLGWCEQNGVKLNPPKGYIGEFTWERYLKETMSLPVPNWAFKPPRSEVSLFRKGMKLEAVDKRNPSLIRVASIADVLMHQIKIHFDGWPAFYDFWVEDTSLDIHPPTWCEKTRHSLLPPLTNEEVHYFLVRGGCRTPGCRGTGHIKGPKFSTHQTTATCPYARENLDNEANLPDRLQGSEKSNEEPISEIEPIQPVKEEVKEKKSSLSSLGRGNRKRKPRKFFDEDNSGLHSSSRVPSPSSEQAKHRRLSSGKSSSGLRPNSSQNHSKKVSDSQEQPSVRCNVFQPGFEYAPPEMPSSAWEKNSEFLRQRVAQLTTREVSTWSPRQVAHFVSTLPGVRMLNGDEIFHRLIEEEVDGEAFLLLSQTDLVKMLGLKLGPAIKVFNAILLIQSGSKNNNNNNNNNGSVRDNAG